MRKINLKLQGKFGKIIGAHCLIESNLIMRRVGYFVKFIEKYGNINVFVNDGSIILKIVAF